MAKKVIEKDVASTAKFHKEKAEYKSTPNGFIRCVVVKAYDGHEVGEELILVERRYKSLIGYVKAI